MNTLAPAIGLLLVAAITPGPNNILIMNAALQGGWRSAARTLLEILAGSLTLFLLANLGLSVVTDQLPFLVTGIVVAGASYLAWMGLALVISTPGASGTDGPPNLTSPISVATFQLLNPKGWVLTSVFLAASAGSSLFVLVFVLLMTLTACLSAWAFAGFALTSAYQNPATRRRIDLGLGGALVLFALLLTVEHFVTETV